MTIHYQGHGVTLHHGDCLDVLRTLPDASVDSVVTDPPYGLEFMGKGWDAPWKAEGKHWREASRLPGSHSTNPTPRPQNFGTAGLPFQQWCELWTAECLRVLKPGGHLLAFGGTRTWHRLACAVEDAGFEVRDSIAWLYGSGFPKSLDVSKAIDKAAGAEREVTGRTVTPFKVDAAATRGTSLQGSVNGDFSKQTEGGYRYTEQTAPATDAAREWEGWGTALKPAFEPVVVARKPLIGTVSANVLAHGTGALNIDGCRIGLASGEDVAALNARSGGRRGFASEYVGGTDHPLPPGADLSKGRWPANVVLDESQAEALDEQSGTLTSDANPTRRGTDKFREAYGDFKGQTECDPARGADAGGASRFFYIAREDNEPCPSASNASTAEPPSSRPSETAGSAPSDAAISGFHDTARPMDSPSTSATPSGSKPTAESATPTTPSTGGESSHDSQPAEPSQMVSRARYAAILSQTGTTTTTTSPSTSDGSAAPATSSTTPTSAPGVPLDALAERFIYVAKADATERPRVNGTAHPTVKPLALMRWLVRLVTPPGGTVLEPFAGSGTTVEACIVEGFDCIAIEREADYLPLIRQRIDRRRDPVAAIRQTGDELGLFELDGEGA